MKHSAHVMQYRDYVVVRRVAKMDADGWTPRASREVLDLQQDQYKEAINWPPLPNSPEQEFHFGPRRSYK